MELQEHILKVAKEEPYMGEEIPLRWLKFEEAKSETQTSMITMSEVSQERWKTNRDSNFDCHLLSLKCILTIV